MSVHLTVPEVYGPHTTVFNRYNRWSKRGLWQGIFASLAGADNPPTVTMIDSSAVKAHRSSAGAHKSPGKKGMKSKPSAAHVALEEPDPSEDPLMVDASTSATQVADEIIKLLGTSATISQGPAAPHIEDATMHWRNRA